MDRRLVAETSAKFRLGYFTVADFDESQQLRMVRTYAPCVAVVEANLLEDALFRRIYRNIRAVVWATQVV